MEASEPMMASTSEETNQALLEAVKRKFANKGKLTNTDGEPAFHIPQLQIPVLRTSAAMTTSAKLPLTFGNTNGNIFKSLHENAKKQLQPQQQQLQPPPTSGFKMPAFKLPAMSEEFSPRQFSLPQLSSNMRNLQLNESLGTHMEAAEATDAIDLTTALRTNETITGKTKKIIANELDFRIPFIDCDVQRSPKPLYDQYCMSAATATADILVYLSNPSGVGRVLKLKIQRGKLVAPYTLSRPKEPVYKIEPFAFNTPSPDDKVLKSLRRPRD